VRREFSDMGLRGVLSEGLTWGLQRSTPIPEEMVSRSEVTVITSSVTCACRHGIIRDWGEDVFGYDVSDSGNDTNREEMGWRSMVAAGPS
jgi:hypothetical protein